MGTLEYLNKKTELLKKAALSVLNNPLHCKELLVLQKSLNLSKDTIIETYVDYDLDISQNNNEMYRSLAMRYVLHMHNLLEGSWHIERQATVHSFVQRVRPRNMVDMGFGVPSQYVKEILKEGKTHICLCDIDDSAFKFADALLRIWESEDYKSQISFEEMDMNTGKIIPDKDLYLFQSSIEHVKECTNYLNTHVKKVKKGAYFIFSLPIGEITPEHYMEWKTFKEAREWVTEAGLEIQDCKRVRVNPQIDLFADFHDFQYEDYFLLCKK